ncbi:MAG: hypothetical protein JW828_02475 [Sedimentisphaerales bacterium]|nr:hypothetical protein [Sedimentisphaerales bacterium]
MGVEQTKNYAWWRGTFAFVLALSVCNSVYGGIFETGYPLVWSLDNRTVAIPSGYVVTDAYVSIRQIKPLSQTSRVHVYLVNNPAAGVHVYGAQEKNTLAEMIPAATVTVDAAQSADVAIDLEKCDNPDSWVWDLYRRPFLLEIGDSEPVVYSSCLLELVDYAGTDTGFGLAFLAEGESIEWDRLELRLIAGPIGKVGPQVSRTYTLTQETFSQNDLSPWQPFDAEIPSVSSFWQLKDSTLSTQPVGDQQIPSDLPILYNSCLSYKRYPAQRNFQTQVLITPQTGGSVGILFRYKDNNNYFRFSWNSVNGRKLVKKTNGVYVVLAGDTILYTPGRTYCFRIEAQDDQIRVYIDDTLVFSVQNFEIETGGFALFTLAGTEARFDNLCFTTCRQNHIPSLLVEGPTTGVVGQPLMYSLTWSDLDGDLMAISVPQGEPGLSFDATGYTWIPDQVGDYKLVFKLSDNFDSISRIVRLRITSGPTEIRRSR